MRHFVKIGVATVLLSTTACVVDHDAPEGADREATEQGFEAFGPNLSLNMRHLTITSIQQPQSTACAWFMTEEYQFIASPWQNYNRLELGACDGTQVTVIAVVLPNAMPRGGDVYGTVEMTNGLQLEITGSFHENSWGQAAFEASAEGANRSVYMQGTSWWNQDDPQMLDRFAGMVTVNN